MSAQSLRSKALERQSKVRLEAHVSVVVGLICGVFFAWTCIIRAQTELAQAGWGILSLWGFYAAYYAYRWVWPQELPEDAPISNCVEFYRRELEKRRDHLRHRWWRSGLPFALLGMTMVLVGTGAQNAPPNPVMNSVPFLVVLAIWVVAFSTMKKKLGRENIQKEIEELRAFETEDRS